MKSSLRLALAFCAFSLVAWTSAATLTIDNSDPGFKSAQGLGIPIFMYHGLDPAGGSVSYDAAIFDQQISWLRSAGFETITLDHLISWQQTGKPALPAKPIVLTFDDNYITIYTVGYPTLKKYGFMGVNFAHTHYVGTVTSYDHADWNEITEMERDGTILTESHTVMHLYLTQQTATALKSELEDSKASIESHVNGKTVRHLAYPYGDNNAAVRAATVAVGYKSAVTTQAGLNTRTTDPYLLWRYTVNPVASLSMATYQGYANAGAGTGNWSTSTAKSGYQGGDYASIAKGDGTANAGWQWIPASTGDCKISVWIPAGAATATNAQYTVRHKDGIATVNLDQTAAANTGQWVLLGTFPFTKDRNAYVAVNNMTDGTVVADAIRIEELNACVNDWTVF